MKKCEEIERSLTKRFRTEIWRKFVRGVSEYELISEGDKVAVCISGGKDSFLLAKCMQELKKHWKVPFDVEFIVMDPGYRKENRDLIEENARQMNIPIKIFETKIFDIVAGLEEGSPCYLCARMRRGYLYEFAHSLGCNKIALGHHFDDAIETVLLSMFYGAEYKTMMPKLRSTNHQGMELIRPLYLVKEEDIIRWKQYNELQFIACACLLTQTSEVNNGKRAEIKRLIKDLRIVNPNVDVNIFSSLHKVNLCTILGYVDKKGNAVSFLDDY